MKPTTQQLKEAAKELNQEMGLRPPIDTEAEHDELIKQINNASWAILKEDEISEKTMKVVKALGWPDVL